MADINVEAVLSKLTDSQKIHLLSGDDFWHTVAVPEYGVPSVRLSDGPNGVRGTQFFNGVPSACFPCGTGLGATWNAELLVEAGVLMGVECHAKGAHVLLGPCINMQRSPLGGRGFESISEDPVLAGLGAASLVSGIQSKGIAATIKHFVCNDQEHERMQYDARVSERALRELYLLPFQIAVRDAYPRAFMTAYNRVNGTHVSENPHILKDVLRGEWGWKGMVMSDWYGTYSTSEAVNAGLDLEMPGKTRWRGGALTHAITCNKVTRRTLDERARQVLNLVKYCSGSGIPENAPEVTNNTPATSKLLRQLAGEAIVLMKNEDSVLPLKKDKKTLIIGPNVKVATYCGGGSSSMAAYYAVSPFEGISKKLKIEPSYTVGCYAHKELPLIGTQVKTAKGKPGLSFTAYLEPPSVKGRKPVDDLVVTNAYMLLMDYKTPERELYYADIEGYYTADKDGEYDLGLCVYGTAKLFVDGNLIIDNATKQAPGSQFFGAGTVEEIGTIPVKKGKTYHVKVEFASGVTSTLGKDVFGGGGVRIGGCMKIDADKEVQHAAALAKEADQVIVCGGLNADWEGEGADRANMDLPGHMNALISAVAAANPNMVVVMQSGTPVEMPWNGTVPAMIQAWYGGNETGNAIADVLFGDVNPSGKLPLTFPKRVQDNPAYLNYTCQRGRTIYGEDVHIGYRYYEALGREVLYPFGHGLSYTSFAFSDLSVQNDEKHVVVSVKVKNTGKVAGAQVVQVYVAQRHPSVSRPPKELKGFGKVFLEAGVSKVVKVEIQTKYAVSFWDEARDAWMTEKDEYMVIVSDSSAVTHENSLIGSFEIKETTWWNGL